MHLRSAELRRSRIARVARLAGCAILALGSAACSSASIPSTPAKPVAAAPPPKDDGKTSQGGAQGEAHSAALEQLKVAPTGPKTDKQNSIVVPLPDAPNWTRVRFLTVPSLVGFRYGKAHHAIVAGFITHVEDNTVEGACTKSFESWAMPWIEAFEVDLRHDPPSAFSWTVPAPKVAAPAPAPSGADPAPPPPKKIAILDIDPVIAKTATVLSRETYAAAWAAYPAWEKACLVVGVAIPGREDEVRAREVRDRFVKDVLPNVKATAVTEPKDRF